MAAGRPAAHGEAVGIVAVLRRVLAQEPNGRANVFHRRGKRRFVNRPVRDARDREAAVQRAELVPHAAIARIPAEPAAAVEEDQERFPFDRLPVFERKEEIQFNLAVADRLIDDVLNRLEFGGLLSARGRRPKNGRRDRGQERQNGSVRRNTFHAILPCNKKTRKRPVRF